MKKLLLFLYFILITSVLIANPIDKKQAHLVAKLYYQFLSGKKVENFDKETSLKYDGTITMYIFTIKEGGFVITSADDNIKPILAYSVDNKFPLPIESPEVKWWLELYSKQIKQALENNYFNSSNKNLWTLYKQGKIQLPKAQITPLINTEWDQIGGDTDYPYNYFCPSNTPVGCVATAAAQVMKYWEYPDKGIGWHTYVHPNFGRLSAIFDTTTFDWNLMPLNSSSFEVALLSYELGVALDMDYAPSGSGSYTFDLTYILPNYFKYSDSIMYYSRAYIENLSGNQAWIDTLKKQLNLGYPVIYAGFGDEGGHAFVCDGYNDQNHFHFNWGWGGSYDGYYDLTNLTPGSSDYSQSQSAVINIKPDDNPQDFFFAVMTQSPFEEDNDAMRYIFAVDENVAYSVPSNSSGIGKTTSGGAIWDYIPLPQEYNNYGVSMVYAINKDTLFVPIFSFTGSGNTYILKSTDGGQTWRNVLEGKQLGTSFFNVIHFFDELNGVVQGDPVNGEFEIYITNDGGENWTEIDGTNIPDAVNNEYGTVGYFYGNENYIWYFTTKGRVFRSLDKGQTWTVQEFITPTNFGDPENNDVTYFAGAFLSNGIGTLVENYYEFTSTDTIVHKYYYYSTDNGDTWTQFYPQENISISQIRVLIDTQFNFESFIAVGNGIFLGSGNQWVPLTDYYKLFNISSADFVNLEYGYLGSYKWRFANGAWIWGINKKAIPDFEVSEYRSCINNDIEFSSSSLGLISDISWDFGEDATPQTASGPGPHIVSYSTPGTKTISLIVTNLDGNNDSIKKQIIIDNQAPNYTVSIEGETLIQINNRYEYKVEDQGDKYKWTFPNEWTVETTGDTSAKKVFVKGTLGSKEIKVYPYNGCGNGQTSSLTVTVVGGVEFAYPNPASKVVYVEDTKNCSVYVYDNSGKLMEQISDAPYLTIINVSDPKYKNGIYNIYIIDEQGNKRNVKFIITK